MKWFCWIIQAFALARLLDGHADLEDEPSQSRRLAQTTFSYTGSVQSFIVPSGIIFLTITVAGAGGKTGTATSCGCVGGNGAVVTATVSVTSGSTVYVYVGGQGAYNSAGYNGGGAPGASGNTQNTGGNGGTDVRTISGDVNSRIIVAGGGGGCDCYCTAVGGYGGLTGSAGNGCGSCHAGGGGTLTGGGSHGYYISNSYSAQDGALFQGGSSAGSGDAGGGGGGGYYGGGGGVCSSGGGGSSLVPSGGTVTDNSNGGAGYCTITYTTVAPTPTPTVQPTDPTSQPSCHPSAQPSNQPSAHPSIQPTSPPTSQPSCQPKVQPSNQPTVQPSIQPSGRPSTQPRSQPSFQPSSQPSNTPTSQPTCQSTTQPSSQPSRQPSRQPSTQPTSMPSIQPFGHPTSQPSRQPSTQPSHQPTIQPTSQPMSRPSRLPTTQPSSQPSLQPTLQPSVQPTAQPADHPSITPTSQPIAFPSRQPSFQPINRPSSQPSSKPTCRPTQQPSEQPFRLPSSQPTKQPTGQPSHQPTFNPFSKPTVQPSVQPSSGPSRQPSSQPSTQPSSKPTVPTGQPSSQPTWEGSRRPSSQPTSQPVTEPTNQPSSLPTMQPNAQPSLQPTRPSIKPSSPSGQPTRPPSCFPTNQSTNQPTEHPLTVAPSKVPTIATTAVPSIAPSVIPSIAPSIAPSNRPSVVPTAVPSIVSSILPSTVSSVVPSAATSMITSLSLTISPSMEPNPGATLPFLSQLGVSIIAPAGQTFRLLLPLELMSQITMSSVLVDIDVTHTLDSPIVVYQSTNATNAHFTTRSFAHSIALDSVMRSAEVIKDFNGDGVQDLIIGDPFSSKCYILFGNSNGLVQMTSGFTIVGEQDSDMTGWSVSDAGDVNNDTLHDVVIGAPVAKGVGAFYIVYGRVNGNSDIYLNSLTDTQGFAVYGYYKGDYFGIAVSGAGDVNGDQFDDVIVGAVLTAKYFAGSALIFYGKKQQNSLTSYLSVSSDSGFMLTGSSYSYTGCSVSRAGDFNGDGYGDVIIGSNPQRSLLPMQSFLVYGSSAKPNSGLISTLTTTQMARFSGGGVVVGTLGDFNNDGFSDVFYVSQLPTTNTGVIVKTNVTGMTLLSCSPTYTPLNAVTRIPSNAVNRPSNAPTTVNPSIIPSKKPSMCPTLRPSSPTKTPIYGTESTVYPSMEPSEAPSEKPSETPTIEPSNLPSKEPSSEPTVYPTVDPSIGPSNVPSPFPMTTFVRTRQPQGIPTLMPTPDVVFDTHITSGVVLQNQLYPGMRYLIDTSQMVTNYNANGNNSYIVSPFTGAILIIQYFNKTNDRIDLTAFPSITAFSQLLITSGSVIITLPNVQIVRIMNLKPTDINGTNFVFYRDEKIAVAHASGFVQHISVFVGMAIGFGGIAFLLLVCLRCVGFISLRLAHWRRSGERRLLLLDVNEDHDWNKSVEVDNECLSANSLNLSEQTIDTEGNLVVKLQQLSVADDGSTKLSDYTIDSVGGLVSKHTKPINEQNDSSDVSNESFDSLGSVSS